MPEDDEGEGKRKLGEEAPTARFSRHLDRVGSEAVARSRRRPKGSSPEACESVPASLGDCLQVDSTIATLYELPFRHSMTAKDLAEIENVFRLGCTEIAAESLTVLGSIDAMISQQWTLRRLLRGDVSSVVGLGPGESARLKVSQSLRKSFTESTLEQTSEMTSNESQVVDKDILEVTRASSKKQDWSVDARATIPVYGAEISIGGSIGQEVSQSVSSALTSLDETTRKSAQQVSTLNKVEVTTTTDEAQSSEASRLIVNPYRDRPIDVFACEVHKEYRVDARVASLRPALVIPIKKLSFDVSFVRANVEFLTSEMIDSGLSLQVSQSLEESQTQSSGETSGARAARLARLAFKYLFDEANIFNVLQVGDVDGNSVDSSFDASLGNSGLKDSLSENAALFFATLNYYWRVYKNERDELSDADVVALATSLYDSIGARWLQLMDADSQVNLGNALDQVNLTEGLRRLSGFASMVGGMVKPLVAPAEAEAASLAARKLTEATVARTIEHLNCFSDYYVARYLLYLQKVTKGVAISSFARQALEAMKNANYPVSSYNAEEAYVSRLEIRIPSNGSLDPDDLIDSIDREYGETTTSCEWATTSVVRVATDGLHIETNASTCVLNDLPLSRPDKRIVTSSLG